jgi:hypothetical protein
MASLTSAAIVSRKIIRYSIYAIILIVILRILINFGVGVYRRLFPEPPPKPTVKFGVLPSLPFPDKVDRQGIQYVLETPDGNLPTFTDQLPIYFMPAATTNIGVLEEAKDKAKKLGFDPEGRELVETVYVFDKVNIPSKLTLNIVTDIFSISYDISANPGIISGIPQGPEQSATVIKNFLNRGGFPNADLTGDVKHEYLDLVNGQFVKVSSPSEARLARTSLFRKKLGTNNDIPSVTPDFTQSNVWFLRSGTGDVLAGEYYYYPIDYQQNGTYPIKTADIAWEDLKAGGAFVANYGDNTNTITIRRVYLAYYDAGQYTEYYQPVVVFEGDNDFAAYVPAVIRDFYGAEPTPTTNPSQPTQPQQ